MPGLLTLARVIDLANEKIGSAVAWLIFASTIISTLNAVVRKALNMSSNGWLELQWYLFSAAFLLAAADTLRRNEHVRIDIIYGMWSRRVQHWIDLFGHVFFLLPFSLMMLWMIYPYVMLSIRSGESSSSAGGLLLWPAKLPMLIGFIILTFQAISEIIKKIAIIRGELDDPFKPEEEDAAGGIAA